jgi:integrase
VVWRQKRCAKYINDNPASNIKPPKRPRTRRKVWKPDQIQAFLMSVQHDRFAALFLLELTTGIRRGQICGLKWSAVDLDAGEITVHDNRVVVGGYARDKEGGCPLRNQLANSVTSWRAFGEVRN